jgi:hypothetical protein
VNRYHGCPFTSLSSISASDSQIASAYILFYLRTLTYMHLRSKGDPHLFLLLLTANESSNSSPRKSSTFDAKVVSLFLHLLSTYLSILVKIHTIDLLGILTFILHQMPIFNSPHLWQGNRAYRLQSVCVDLLTCLPQSDSNPNHPRQLSDYPPPSRIVWAVKSYAPSFSICEIPHLLTQGEISIVQILLNSICPLLQSACVTPHISWVPH